MQEMYFYRNVFYKTNDREGWNLALITGNDDEVRKKCQAHKDWIDYDIRCGGKTAAKLEDRMNYYPRPDIVHQLTDWVYSKELDKWFIKSKEGLPYPSIKCEKSNNIDFTYSLDNDDENNADNFDEKEEVYISAIINISTDTQNTHDIVEISALYKSFEKFINELKEKKFAVLHIEEFSCTKYLAWEKDGKIRFTVQDYSGKSKEEYVPVTLDVLVDKNLFYDRFENFYYNLKKDSLNLKQELISIINNR